MHEKLSELPRTTVGDHAIDGEHFAHIGHEDLYRALEIIDTRNRPNASVGAEGGREINILRLEPSGSSDPAKKDGMYIAWEYLGEEADDA